MFRDKSTGRCYGDASLHEEDLLKSVTSCFGGGGGGGDVKGGTDTVYVRPSS